MSSLFHSQEFDEVVSITDRLDAVDGIEVADVEQTQKIVPFITCEISHVSASWFFTPLVCGVLVVRHC